MSSKSRQLGRRERHRRQKLRSIIRWGALGAVGLAVLGFVVWRDVRPAEGESMPIMPSSHVPSASDPGSYNSDPPTSGPHYAEEAKAGFYDTSPYTRSAGYLVHNLEHGYVIFWYNCQSLPDDSCAALKADIQTLMQERGGTKLIAFPWPSLDVPLAMTSWGRLEKFAAFDEEKAKAFIRSNLNRAPEPDAP